MITYDEAYAKAIKIVREKWLQEVKHQLQNRFGMGELKWTEVVEEVHGDPDYTGEKEAIPAIEVEYQGRKTTFYPFLLLHYELLEMAYNLAENVAKEIAGPELSARIWPDYTVRRSDVYTYVGFPRMYQDAGVMRIQELMEQLGETDYEIIDKPSSLPEETACAFLYDPVNRKFMDVKNVETNYFCCIKTKLNMEDMHTVVADLMVHPSTVLEKVRMVET